MDWTRKVNPVSGAGGDLEADKSGDVSQKTRGPAGRDPGQPRVRANPSQNPFGKMLERTIQNLTPALPPQICAARSRAPARHRAGARLWTQPVNDICLRPAIQNIVVVFSYCWGRKGHISATFRT